MIVSVRDRGKGIATKVLKDLVLIAKRNQLKAICSTEKSNTAAQKPSCDPVL
jgi:ribosomal protein S18 acetylase RimI-like enzyme